MQDSDRVSQEVQFDYKDDGFYFLDHSKLIEILRFLILKVCFNGEIGVDGGGEKKMMEWLVYPYFWAYLLTALKYFNGKVHFVTEIEVQYSMW